MAGGVKVVVCCGSGVASSTVAQEKVRAIAKKNNIPIDIHTGSIQDIQNVAKQYDVVLTTANFKGELDKPHMSVFPLISGVKRAQCEQELVDMLKAAQQNL